MPRAKLCQAFSLRMSRFILNLAFFYFAEVYLLPGVYRSISFRPVPEFLI